MRPACWPAPCLPRDACSCKLGARPFALAAVQWGIARFRSLEDSVRAKKALAKQVMPGCASGIVPCTERAVRMHRCAGGRWRHSGRHTCMCQLAACLQPLRDPRVKSVPPRHLQVLPGISVMPLKVTYYHPHHSKAK